MDRGGGRPQSAPPMGGGMGGGGMQGYGPPQPARKGGAISGVVFKSVDVTVPRLMFCAVQLVGLCLALRKLNVMGLLPTHASDWASGMKPPRALERAFGDVELDL